MIENSHLESSTQCWDQYKLLLSENASDACYVLIMPMPQIDSSAGIYETNEIFIEKPHCPERNQLSPNQMDHQVSPMHSSARLVAGHSYGRTYSQVA